MRIAPVIHRGFACHIPRAAFVLMGKKRSGAPAGPAGAVRKGVPAKGSRQRRGGVILGVAVPPV